MCAALRLCRKAACQSGVVIRRRNEGAWLVFNSVVWIAGFADEGWLMALNAQHQRAHALSVSVIPAVGGGDP